MASEKTNLSNVKVDFDKWNELTYERKKKKLTRDQAIEQAVELFIEKCKEDDKK